MISHKHKCIFIHIPKAAGTSVETFFLNDLNLDFEDKHSLILGKTTNMYAQLRALSHLTITEMLDQHYISKEIFDSYFKFSTVRNPVSRLYSTYVYWGFSAVITFDTFVKILLKKLIKSKKYGFFLKSQTEFMFDKDNTTNLMNSVIKFENLKQEFTDIAIGLNFKNVELPYSNKGKKSSFLRGVKKIIDNKELLVKLNFSKNKSKELSNQSKKIIFYHYKDDFNNFGYEI